MRGIYRVNYRISAVVAAKTLMYLTAPAAVSVDILAARITNESNETNEQMVAAWQRVTSLGTPTATTVTPAKSEFGDQAAASTVKANVTANEPTYGAIAQGAAIIDVEGLMGFASLSGYFYQPTPEERLTIKVGETWGLRLIAPAVPLSFDCCIEVVFQERG